MSVEDVVKLIKATEGEVTMLLRVRFEDTVTATVEKTSNDMKTGMILKGNEGVYIKDFHDTSPFKGKLPEGPEYYVTMVNDVSVKNMSTNEIVQVLNDVPQGPLTIRMEKNPDAADATGNRDASPPPGVPAGGEWGKVMYAGNVTGIMTCIGCLCFGLPGLCVLCCPCDERDVYLVNGKLYSSDGRIAGEPADKFIPLRRTPANQTMSR